jgi:hypothetical protein
MLNGPVSKGAALEAALSCGVCDFPGGIPAEATNEFCLSRYRVSLSAVGRLVATLIPLYWEQFA